jgi:hypothetical protein
VRHAPTAEALALSAGPVPGQPGNRESENEGVA